MLILSFKKLRIALLQIIVQQPALWVENSYSWFGLLWAVLCCSSCYPLQHRSLRQSSWLPAISNPPPHTELIIFLHPTKVSKYHLGSKLWGNSPEGSEPDPQNRLWKSGQDRGYWHTMARFHGGLAERTWQQSMKADIILLSLDHDTQFQTLLLKYDTTTSDINWQKLAYFESFSRIRAVVLMGAECTSAHHCAKDSFLSEFCTSQPAADCEELHWTVLTPISDNEREFSLRVAVDRSFGSINGTEDSIPSLNASEGWAGHGLGTNGDCGLIFSTAGDNIGGLGWNRVALRRIVSITERWKARLRSLARRYNCDRNTCSNLSMQIRWICTPSGETS